MTSRFKELTPSEMTDAQRKAYESIVSGPRGGARGPFNALLRSPELADRVQRVGEYIRFNSSLPARLNELAILVVARYWSAQYEWYAHRLLALAAGLDSQLIDSLALGKRPAKMRVDESAVYDFCRELHETKAVADSTYAAALAQCGEQGVIDLLGVSGYYTLVSMVLNIDRHPLPDGVEPLPPIRQK